MRARAALLAALTVITALLCRWSPEIQGGAQTGVVMQLPGGIQNFSAEIVGPDPIEKKLLPSDTEISKAIYRTRSSGPSTRDAVHFTVILSGCERRSIHRPEVCLQGQGWSLIDSRVQPVSITSSQTLLVTDLHISKQVPLRDGTRRVLHAHYFYWFIGQDLTTPSHTERIWLTVKDNITRGVNHRWACASALAYVTENFTSQEIGERPRSNDTTLALLGNFIRDLVPHFQKSFMDNPPVAAAH